MEELQNFEAAGYKPTLRAMFYRLYSRGLIPNTSTTYDSLSRATVEARWKGQLNMDCFADNSRQVIGDFNERYVTPEELNEEKIEYLSRITDDYSDYIPRWHDQPKYVEVWIEKDAMASTFQSILQDMEVRIVPNKGFSSMTFLHQTARRLYHFLNMGKKVHVLYYGDFDPSGDYMVTDLNNRIRRMGIDLNLDNREFERVAVTPEQIEQYNLPYNPDEETERKMRRDVQTARFLAKYGKLYAVELDALPALIPDVFKQELVINKVQQYFDNEIYENLLERYKPEDIKKILKYKMRKSADKL